MDWNNVNLNDSYERDQNIIDPLNFDTLLLLISCNLKVVNRDTIYAEFERDLQCKISSAREIMKANLDNITFKAIEEKEDN